MEGRGHQAAGLNYFSHDTTTVDARDQPKGPLAYVSGSILHGLYITYFQVILLFLIKFANSQWFGLLSVCLFEHAANIVNTFDLRRATCSILFITT